MHAGRVSRDLARARDRYLANAKTTGPGQNWTVPAVIHNPLRMISR